MRKLAAAFILYAASLIPCSQSSSPDISSNSTLHATAMPLNPELYEAAPTNLVLDQVHVYVRHGERTPVSVRMDGPPASIPGDWKLCKWSRQFRTSVLGTPEEGEPLYIQRIAQKRNGTIVDGLCMPGELTDLGRESTHNVGASLRKIYIDRLAFLPDVLVHTEDVNFRSTNVPRTIDSLQHIIHGLYPADKYAENIHPQMIVRDHKEENLFPNPSACPRLRVILKQFEKAAPVKYNKLLEPLDEKLSKYIDGNPVRIDGKPRASGLMDTIMAAQAHGIDVPPEFKEPKVRGTLESAVCGEWFDKYQSSEMRRLAVGPMLQELRGRLEKKVEQGEKDPLKIAVHSCHDVSLANLCNTLDVFDGKWPPFAGSITFELFREQSTPPSSPFGLFQSLLGTRPQEKRYIRMRYRNQDLKLPACAEEGKHLKGSPQFCTLSAFQERMRELVPEDWEKECSFPNPGSERSK